MISLGSVDIILLLLLILALYSAATRRATGVAIVVVALLFIILLERVAPGTLTAVGSAIRSLDQVNNAGPHLNIAPIITFK
jgi:hypothetical protein